ncbi:MAG: hypothetical protein HYX95_03360 [Chloroflexi bacterium]|nr:hypothetical protein [Chloroflexota bacterium]
MKIQDEEQNTAKYTGGGNLNEDIKGMVMGVISRRRGYKEIGRATYGVEGLRVHARFCSTDKNGSSKYKFNINPNTLSADQELWICGHSDSWYLIPVQVVKTMYSHPNAYIDRHHPNIRVISVDIADHRATYASGAIYVDLSKCFRGLMSA